MAKEYINLKIMKDMMANGKMEACMEMENITNWMKNIKAIGLKVKKVVLEFLPIIMVTNMKANGSMTKKMEREFYFFKMEVKMQVYG
jgi:hypothetical protein